MSVLKEKVEQLIDEAQRRKYSFTMFRQALNNVTLPTSNGWKPLKEKFLEELNLHKDNYEEQLKIYSSLKDIFESFINYNHKAVYLYQLSKDEFNDLKSAIDSYLSANDSVRDEIAEIYPMTLEESRLVELHDTYKIPIIVKYNSDNNKHTYHSTVFSSDVLRVELDGEMSAGYIDDSFYESFESLVGYKSQYHQTIDKIILDSENNRLYLYIDMGLLRTTAKSDQIAAKYIHLFNQLIEPKKIPFELKGVSLVTKIQELYNDYSYDSKVKELNHHTSTNSTKQEKMKNNKDLREELYHKGGYESIDFKSELYYIKIGYNISLDGSLDLTIPGSLRNNNWDNRAILENCQSQEDIDFLITKLIYPITQCND